jgi:hypothetical protein
LKLCGFRTQKIHCQRKSDSHKKLNRDDKVRFITGSGEHLNMKIFDERSLRISNEENMKKLVGYCRGEHD